MTADQSPLGKKSAYVDEYDASLLFPILRKGKRDEISVPEKLPFFGVDIWNAYELSWLNEKGKPIVAMATFTIPCESPYLIESKSLKLYLNSFNSTKFSDKNKVVSILRRDLSEAVGLPVKVEIKSNADFTNFEGENLDALDIFCNAYTINASFLSTGETIVDEKLYSDLLKSNCLVTGQPDWGSVSIAYKGKQIHREGLLKYIVSFRNHNEFHEQCVERIFMDIITHCCPLTLTVYARYTRRGGLDINPIRSTAPVIDMNNSRLFRQ